MAFLEYIPLGKTSTRPTLIALICIALSSPQKVNAQHFPQDYPVLEVGNTLERRDCVNPCGWSGQLCCGVGQSCLIGSVGQAQCVTSRGGGTNQQKDNSQWQLLITTYVQSDLVTRTSTYSYLIGASQPTSDVVETVTNGGGKTTSTSNAIETVTFGGEITTSNKALSAGAIAGIVIGILFGIPLIILQVLGLLRLLRREERNFNFAENDGYWWRRDGPEKIKPTPNRSPGGREVRYLIDGGDGRRWWMVEPEKKKKRRHRSSRGKKRYFIDGGDDIYWRRGELIVRLPRSPGGGEVRYVVHRSSSRDRDARRPRPRVRLSLSPDPDVRRPRSYDRLRPSPDFDARRPRSYDRLRPSPNFDARRPRSYDRLRPSPNFDARRPRSYDRLRPSLNFDAGRSSRNLRQDTREDSWSDLPPSLTFDAGRPVAVETQDATIGWGPDEWEQAERRERRRRFTERNVESYPTERNVESYPTERNVESYPTERNVEFYPSERNLESPY